MQITIENLRKNYQRYSDDEIVRIATKEAHLLSPEAVEVLQEEIAKRQLSPDLLKGIAVQLKNVSEQELWDYCELLRSLPCPVCNANTNQLNATITATVTSFVITYYKKELLIACPTCLDKANKTALIKTLLLGWWGFPWGIIRTIQAVMLNSNMSRIAQHSQPNMLLKEFVLQQIGTIESNKDKPERLQSLIKHLA
ncbi:MAG: hypothetical protein JNM36_03875 [Chitinophagales bacterium]|jgi:hypothetical protein|nr:hypothetical protein [Chitinophagales bacterium]HNI44035.1 hypothetical protein [Chitinophagales bacterium]HNL06011.1 hypothetical protein [Chitinophagales bacterium]